MEKENNITTGMVQNQPSADGALSSDGAIAEPEAVGQTEDVSSFVQKTNATNKEDYYKVVRPKFGMDSFDAMLAFTKDCTEYVPEVVMTVVDVVTTKEEQDLCRSICESVGAVFRVRPYESN